MTSTASVADAKPVRSAGQKLLSFGERHPWILFVLSLIWLPAAIDDARSMRLWLDEIVTLYLSRMSPGNLVDALRHGVDLQPPFFYWVTRGFESLFGYSELGVRSQAIFFFTAFTLILFQFVRAKLGTWYGWAAIWLALNTLAFGYSTAGYSSDGRPYAMLIAFASLSLLCCSLYWANPRLWTLIAIAFSVAATVSTHYYGIFAILPLLAGEAFRWHQLRRFDLRLPVAIAVGLTPLIFLVPIARSGVSSHPPNPWNPVTISSLGSVWGVLLSSRIPVPFFLSLAIVFFAWRRFCEDVPWKAFRLSPDVIAGVSFLAIPIPAVIVAKLGANMIFFRYLLPVVIGLVVLCILTLYRVARASRELALLVSLGCIVWFLYTWVPHYHLHFPAQPGRLSIPAPDDALPIIIASSGDHALYFHYGASSLRARLFIVTDAEVSSRYPGQADVALTMMHTAPYFSFHTIDFRGLVERREFYVWEVNGASGSGWLIPELLGRGAHVDVAYADQAAILYRVHLP